MRLLMTGDTAGGVLTFVTQLANGLTSSGWHVTLATFGPEPKDPPNVPRWFHHTSKLEWQPDPWIGLERGGDWLRGLVSRLDPDLLHFNTLCHGDLGWRVPLVTTIHSCVPTWWSQVKRSRLPAQWDRYRNVVAQSLKCACRLITPSKALLSSLRNQWAIDFTNATVIPNGVECTHLRAATKEPFVLSVGRFWDEAKNVQALKRVAPLIDWPIYLAGEADTDSRCRSLGQLNSSELANWYSRASVFVSAAKYEPFGLAVLEAAASGCALLLSDIPSFRENWSDAALFFQPGQLHRALAKLIRMPDLRYRLQAQALHRSKRFTRQAMVRRYINAYQNCGSLACAS